MLSHEPRAISHWHKLVEDFSTSSLDFYTALEAEVRRRKPPQISISKVEHEEGGFFSDNRIYLRVTRQRLAFDVCAAPFGTGFFFSWWLTEVPLSPQLGCVVVLALFVLAGVVLKDFGLEGIFYASLVMIATTILVLLGAKGGWLISEDTMLALPYLGPIYEKIFQPETHYRKDTATMFQETVHAAVLEAVDAVLTSQGLRALAPEDRKPVIRDLLR